MTGKAVDDVDKALGAWFPPGLPPQATFSETDIRDISEVLRRYGKDTWSRVPRIYITLRLIDVVSAIEVFLDAMITKCLSHSVNELYPRLLKVRTSDQTSLRSKQAY